MSPRDVNYKKKERERERGGGGKGLRKNFPATEAAFRLDPIQTVYSSGFFGH